MAKKDEKILTREIVEKLGLDKISVITADMLDGYTSIRESVFAGCKGLVSMVIPNSVTSIGNWAFYNCSSLTSIIVENGNSFYDSRNNCNAIIETATNTLIVGCMNTIIPNSVTSIGHLAFYGCKGLTSVTIPNSVTSIGNGAFEGCSSLTSIELPNSVTNIGDWAFQDCTGLTSVTIPNGVTSIGESAFEDCRGLTSVTIGNSVTSIGERAFLHCSRLTSIEIPDSVTSIGFAAFWGCSGLISVTIPNSVTSIGEYAFSGCSGLTSPVYNAHVFAYMPNSYLGAYTIPDGIESIAGGAFADCTGLTLITIGNKIYEKQTVTNCKCKAYKAFNANMTCRDFQYKEGKTYELDGEPILCERGFHACLNFTDIFTYYCGELGKDIVVHEVELEGVSDERRSDSKVVAKKITIGKRIL